MENPDLTELIKRAGEAAGSEYKLAKLLGIPQQHISNWKSGYRTCTPEDQAQMAHIAGLDAMQVLARAVIQKHQGTAKGDRLFVALGKRLHLTGEAIGSAGAVALVACSSLMDVAKTIQCALC